MTFEPGMPSARTVLVLAALLLLATAVFGLGAAYERARALPPENHAALEAGGGMHDEAREAIERESVAGFNVESGTAIGVAVAFSLFFASAVLLRASRPILLGVVAFGGAFVAADALEIARQVAEACLVLAATAGLAGLLHLAAAGLAARLAWNPRMG